MHDPFWSVRAVHLLALETQRLAGQAGHVVNFRVVVFRYMVARFCFLDVCVRMPSMPRLGIVASETQTPSARERPPTLPLACPARSCPGPFCFTGSAVGEACQEIAVSVVLSRILSIDERKKSDRTSTHVNILLED